MSEQEMREMTLAEWVDTLPPTHRARKEHDRLRAELEQAEREVVNRAFFEEQLRKQRDEGSE